MAKRVILIVMDSLGAGALPDAADYGDLGANTLGHIIERVPDLHLPNLGKMGLGSIPGIHLPKQPEVVTGAYGRAAEQSRCKDTIAGHWEIAGVITETPFRTFTETGFPEKFINAFTQRIGTPVLGNYSASGVEIIEELGPEQRRTGFPIVYTSADSVFQIAADTDVITLEKLYEMCSVAREMLTGDLLVGRVIARPYVYRNGVYTRTADRRDYAVDPSAPTILESILEAGKEVCAVGKIEDIFNGKGISRSIHTANNEEGMEKTLEFMKSCKNGLIFTNLVDFDSLYGHRRDPEGYAEAIRRFDEVIPAVRDAMGPEDLLIITADHGNDPVHTGWNHTREFVPVLAAGETVGVNIDLGTLESFADIGASVCDYLDVKWTGAGRSFLAKIIG